MTTDEKLALFQTELSSNGFLQRAGFSFVGAKFVPPTNLLGGAHKLSFGNDKGRSIEISYYSSDQNEFFLVSVVNTQLSKTFNISHWLKKRGVPVDLGSFKLASYDGDLQSRLRGFVEWLRVVLDTPGLAEIFRGEHWEDVAFDWAGMR